MAAINNKAYLLHTTHVSRSCYYSLEGTCLSPRLTHFHLILYRIPVLMVLSPQTSHGEEGLVTEAVYGGGFEETNPDFPSLPSLWRTHGHFVQNIQTITFMNCVPMFFIDRNIEMHPYFVSAKRGSVVRSQTTAFSLTTLELHIGVTEIFQHRAN